MSSILVYKCGQILSFSKISFYVAVYFITHMIRYREPIILISASKAVNLRSWFYLITSVKSCNTASRQTTTAFVTFMCSIFHVLIRRVKYIKTATNTFWFCGCSFNAQRPPTCFGHSCGHLQGGENKNATRINFNYIYR